MKLYGLLVILAVGIVPYWVSGSDSLFTQEELGNLRKPQPFRQDAQDELSENNDKILINWLENCRSTLMNSKFGVYIHERDFSSGKSDFPAF